jgi:hypothetical protein
VHFPPEYQLGRGSPRPCKIRVNLVAAATCLRCASAALIGG